MQLAECKRTDEIPLATTDVEGDKAASPKVLSGQIQSGWGGQGGH